jgi:hypothetical protein
MKKISIMLMFSILLSGGLVGALTAPSQAQVFVPPPPPQPAMAPWVGSNTPWVFYNGDWFRNGVLYYFFGNKYGWAPYYSYAPTYIVRPNSWYAPSWHAWYQKHPVYWQNFNRQYPYWRSHQTGRHYDQNFYNKYHRGQGEGWQKGFHGAPYNRPQPERRSVQPESRHPGAPAAREISPGHQPGAPDNRSHRPDTPGSGYDRPAATPSGQFQPHGQPSSRQPGPGREGVPPRHPSE